MIEVPEKTLNDFAAACRKVADYGLVRCSSGNMSLRLDAQTMLVKASRAWMKEMTTADVALCRIADGAPLTDKVPSVEIGFHAGVLRTRPEVQVVLHFQTPAATALACCQDLSSINFFVIPEIAYYIGPIGLVSYIVPGSPQLASAVVATMKGHDLAMLASHGQVVVGKTYDDVIQKAAFFELACEIILRGQDRLTRLTETQIGQLRGGRGA